MIPSFEYTFSEEDIQSIQSDIGDLFRQRKFLNNGSHCGKLEKEFSEYHQSPFALTSNSGTSALELLLATQELKGKEVLVPTNTFTATIIPILRLGGKPIFVDCAEDFSLCPNDLKNKLSANTVGVVTVHIGGRISPHTKTIQEFCKMKNLFFFEDAAHAHGATLEGKYAGEFSDGAAFSFYSTKVMTSGEGGILLTSHSQIYEQAKLLRNHGQESDNYVTAEGHNYRMTEFSAIVGLHQLRRLREFVEKRTSIADFYNRSLSSLSNIQLPWPSDSSLPSFYKFLVVPDNKIDPDRITEQMWDKYQIKMAGKVYPIPCHKQPVFSWANNQHHPRAERLSKQHLCLPLWPHMDLATQEKIIESFKRCLAN